MELHVTNRTKLTGKQKEIEEYMKISYLCYMIEWLELSDKILDEYIYWMNKRHKFYGDRIKKPIKKKLEKFSVWHLNNFKYIIRDVKISSNYVFLKNDVDTENLKHVLDFYEMIMHIVDECINENYYYGRGLNKEENNLIKNKISDLYPNSEMICYHETIRFWVSKQYIDDVNKFTESLKKYFPKQMNIDFEDDSSIIIEIDNKSRYLCFGDIWEILSYCNSEALYFDINYDLTTNKKLVLDLTVNM